MAYAPKLFHPTFSWHVAWNIKNFKDKINKNVQNDLQGSNRKLNEMLKN